MLPVLLPLFLRAYTCTTFLEIKICSIKINQETDSSRKYLCRIVGMYDRKEKIMSFATVLCLVPENVYGRL